MDPFKIHNGFPPPFITAAAPAAPAAAPAPAPAAAAAPAPAPAPRDLDLAAEIELSEKAKTCVEWIGFSLHFQTDKDFTLEQLDKCLLVVANKLHYPPDLQKSPNVPQSIAPGITLAFFDLLDRINGQVLFAAGKPYKLGVQPNAPSCQDPCASPKAVLQAFNAVQEAFAELKFEDLVTVLLRRRGTLQQRFYQLPRTML